MTADFGYKLGTTARIDYSVGRQRFATASGRTFVSMCLGPFASRKWGRCIPERRCTSHYPHKFECSESGLAIFNPEFKVYKCKYTRTHGMRNPKSLSTKCGLIPFSTQVMQRIPSKHIEVGSNYFTLINCFVVPTRKRGASLRIYTR